MFIIASSTLSFPSLIRYNAFQDIFILTHPLYSNKTSISNDIYTSTLLIEAPLFPITFQDSTVKTTVLFNIKREEQQLQKTSSLPLQVEYLFSFGVDIMFLFFTNCVLYILCFDNSNKQFLKQNMCSSYFWLTIYAKSPKITA